jgi:hypothetical protein
VVETSKPPKRGVRAKNKLAKDLEAAWNRCMEGKDENDESSIFYGFTAVPDIVLRAVFRSNCKLKDITTYAFMLSREIRWMFLNKGNVNKWSRGRFASIQQIAVESSSTLHTAKYYVQWRNAQPWCEKWKHDRVWHWRPNEQFLGFLEGGRPLINAEEWERKVGTA